MPSPCNTSSPAHTVRVCGLLVSFCRLARVFVSGPCTYTPLHRLSNLPAAVAPDGLRTFGPISSSENAAPLAPLLPGIRWTSGTGAADSSVRACSHVAWI